MHYRGKRGTPHSKRERGKRVRRVAERVVEARELGTHSGRRRRRNARGERRTDKAHGSRPRPPRPHGPTSAVWGGGGTLGGLASQLALLGEEQGIDDLVRSACCVRRLSPVDRTAKPR